MWYKRYHLYVFNESNIFTALSFMYNKRDIIELSWRDKNVKRILFWFNSHSEHLWNIYFFVISVVASGQGIPLETFWWKSHPVRLQLEASYVPTERRGTRQTDRPESLQTVPGGQDQAPARFHMGIGRCKLKRHFISWR